MNSHSSIPNIKAVFIGPNVGPFLIYSEKMNCRKPSLNELSALIWAEKSRESLDDLNGSKKVSSLT
jgi:hypothetical protein